MKDLFFYSSPSPSPSSELPPMYDSMVQEYLSLGAVDRRRYREMYKRIYRYLWPYSYIHGAVNSFTYSYLHDKIAKSLNIPLSSLHALAWIYHFTDRGKQSINTQQLKIPKQLQNPTRLLRNKKLIMRTNYDISLPYMVKDRHPVFLSLTPSGLRLFIQAMNMLDYAAMRSYK